MDVEQVQGKHKYRGKLYGLSEDSSWEDKGTGYVAVTDGDEGRRLVFRDEYDGEVIHDRPLLASSFYQLQGEGEKQTIIVWDDPEQGKDWALSFQDAAGTTDIWEAITAEPGSAPGKQRVLPLPEMGSLMELSRMLTGVPPSQREALVAECMSAKFLEGLRDAFHIAEDLGSEAELSWLWRIAKGIFLLSNQKLTERYLRPEMYEDIFGMLEYDDGLPVDKRIAHRQVLKVQVHCHHVLAFEDADMLERIHLNYRLQYLKDIVLPRLLDEGSFASMVQMIQANLSIILNHLQKSKQLLDRLFMQVRQKDLQSVLFLQDVCRLAKQIPPSQRQALYERMAEQNMYEALGPFFAEGCAEGESGLAHPRHLSVEILLLSASSDASHLRRYLLGVGGAEGRTLLSTLMRMVLIEEDQGIQGQTTEMLKFIMDVASLDAGERDNCLAVLYDGGAIDELTALLRTDVGKLGPSACFGLQMVCDLLAFAVVHHGERCKAHVVRHGLVQQAARLMAAPQRFLQLAPVRLLRAVIGTKDDAYHRYLAKSGVFALLLRAFQQSLQPPSLGESLLASAVLELLDFVRIENARVLVDHICGKHGAALREHAGKFKTMEALLLRHQHNLESAAQLPPDDPLAAKACPSAPPPSPNSDRSEDQLASSHWPGLEGSGGEDGGEDEASLEPPGEDADGGRSVAAPPSQEAECGAPPGGGSPSVPSDGGGPGLQQVPSAGAEGADVSVASVGEEVPGAGALPQGLLVSCESEPEEQQDPGRPPTAAPAAPAASGAEGTEADPDADPGAGGGDGADSGAGLSSVDSAVEVGGVADDTTDAVEAEDGGGGAGGAAKRPGGGEGPPKAGGEGTEPQLVEAQAEADGEAKAGSEKVLNHISKRLKTSALA